MLADPAIGPVMVSSMKEAREAATADPHKDLRDWLDGQVFRSLADQGYFSSYTCTALSISTDGFQAWKQHAFEGWLINAAILNVHPSSRVQMVSQVFLGITRGPGQQADLESLLHPIAEELNALATGLSGVSVAGFAEPPMAQAFVIHFTTYVPAGDELPTVIAGNR